MFIADIEPKPPFDITPSLTYIMILGLLGWLFYGRCSPWTNRFSGWGYIITNYTFDTPPTHTHIL
jgi:hypothetical protein